MIRNQNHVLTDDELVIVRGLIKEPKQASLYIRNEHATEFRVLNQILVSDF